MNEQTFVCRKAIQDDETYIYEVLQDVASEIPVSLDDPDRERAMQGIIIECRQSGDSWVALDLDGATIGFALAKPDRIERFQKGNSAVHLHYIGVKKSARNRGVLAALMAKLKLGGEPITAVVLNGNKSGMKDRLVKSGFTQTESDDKQAKLRWSHNDA